MCVLGYSPPANQWTSVAEKIAPPTPDVEDHTQALAQLRLVCLWAIHTSQLLVFFRQCHYVPEARSESVIFLHGVFIHVSHHFCHKNGHLSILTLPTTHAEMGYHSAVSFLMFCSIICFPCPDLVLIVLGLQPRFQVTCVCIFYYNKVNVILKCSFCFASSERLSTIEIFILVSQKLTEQNGRLPCVRLSMCSSRTACHDSLMGGIYGRGIWRSYRHS